MSGEIAKMGQTGELSVKLTDGVPLIFWALWFGIIELLVWSHQHRWSFHLFFVFNVIVGLVIGLILCIAISYVCWEGN